MVYCVGTSCLKYEDKKRLNIDLPIKTRQKRVGNKKS
jgi:hypothetical protein